MMKAVSALALLAWALVVNPAWAQSVSLFTNSVPPATVESSTQARTLGLKFWSTQVGTISAIRFWRGAKSKHGYTVGLYTASGSLLASARVNHDPGPIPGWQQVVLPSPISINANTTYVASYYAPSGQYTQLQYGLAQTVTNGPLNAPAGTTVGGNGVYTLGRGFPTVGGAYGTWDSTNFFVDLVFTPAPSTIPYLSIVVNPASPTIPASAALGSVVASVAATWSDGAPFTGTINFGPPNGNDGGIFALDASRNLIVNPAGPGVGPLGGTLQNITLVATQ